MTARRTNLSRRNPASFGSVERRGERYRALYRRDGEVIRAPKTFDNAKQAHAWLAKEATAHATGAWVDPRAGAETLASYATAWLDSRRDLSPRTLATYRQSLDRWVIPLLGDERLDAITPTRVRSWHAEITRRASGGSETGALRTGPHPARVWARTEGFAAPATGRPSRALLAAWEAAGSPTPGRRQTDGAATVAGAYRILRTLLIAAEREELIARNPCRIVGAGTVRVKDRIPATPQEIERIAAAMPARLRAAVVLAAWSGLRSGELRALARRHVDLAAGVVRVERSVIEVPREPRRLGPTKTAGSRRAVAIPAFVVRVLREHLSAHVLEDADSLIFATEAGGILGNTYLNAAFRTARSVAGRPDLRWHDLRHTGASLAYAAGASVPDVQRRLGHTTMRAATIYAHGYESADHALAARLDAAFGRQGDEAEKSL